MIQRFQKLSKRVADKFNQSKTAVLTVGALTVGAVQAQAALVAPTFAADDAITVGTAVLGGLALIWAIKKAIAMAK